MKTYTNINQIEIKKNQALIIDFIKTSNLWYLIPLINRVGFFQGKWIPCCESQQRISDSFDSSRGCINRTVQEAVKLGIIVVKKKRFPGSKWLHNVMHLSRIMFTKEIRESLEGLLTIFHLQSNVSINSVTLINKTASLFESYWAKKVKSSKTYPQQTLKSSMWDNLLA